jgi:hypothetical protein
MNMYKKTWLMGKSPIGATRFGNIFLFNSQSLNKATVSSIGERDHLEGYDRVTFRLRDQDGLLELCETSSFKYI